MHEGRRLCDLQVHGAESPKLCPFFHRRREWWGAAGVQRNEVPNHTSPGPSEGDTTSAESDAAIGTVQTNTSWPRHLHLTDSFLPLSLGIAFSTQRETHVYFLSRGSRLEWARWIALWPRTTGKQKPHDTRASANTVGAAIPRTIVIKSNQKTDCKAPHQCLRLHCSRCTLLPVFLRHTLGPPRGAILSNRRNAY